MEHVFSCLTSQSGHGCCTGDVPVMVHGNWTKSGVNILFIDRNPLSVHLPVVYMFFAASQVQSLCCCWRCLSGCVNVRVSGGGLSSCQSVGQVQYGSWGTVMG